MAFKKKTIQDIDLAGKVVLIRVDYNVPMNNGQIVNDMRISASLSTIRYALDQGAKKVILISHMGRPKGTFVPELSLALCAKRLGELMPDKVVRFSKMIYGPDAKAAVDDLPDGGVLLLENLRFVPLEEENSTNLAREIVLATGAQVFVQDGFSILHREQSSTVAITRLLPSVAGFLVEQEVSKLQKAIENPERPLLVIIGGAKVEDKAPLIDRFVLIADNVAVAGKIAADGYQAKSPKVYVAEDFVSDENGNKLDIGEKSVAKITELISQAKTIIWNGTLGAVEDDRFIKGSEAIANAMGNNRNAMTIVGGGDTAGFVSGMLEKDHVLAFDLVSTGGGACLELLAGKPLPGLDALQDKEQE
ncbi:phosphoglycerate kinase [Candidatus Saccharibacteria bacterium]|nr:phosphoglycerate kinase [Candidatus Saccharibacteria bacterium]